MKEFISIEFYGQIKSIIDNARNKAYSAVNCAMVEAYWHIGKVLVEQEQGGQKRAEYGKQVVQDVSKRLTDEFGKGFSPQNLWNMRLFYQKFSSLRRELSWTHCKALLSVKNPII